MAANILDELLGLFDKATVKNTADALGESREAIASAVRPAIATVTEAANACSSTFDGAEHLLRTVSEFEGNLYRNYKLIVESGSQGDIVELGRRASVGILGDRNDELVERLQDLSGLSPTGSQEFLNLITALVIDLAGEEQAAESLNRDGVKKYFEAQRTLLLAELPTDLLTEVGLIQPEHRGLNEDHLGLSDFAPKSEDFTPPLQETEVTEQLPIAGHVAEFEVNLDETQEKEVFANDSLGTEPEEIFVSVNEAPKPSIEKEHRRDYELSFEEKKAFYFKAGLVLATLGTLWFWTISVVGKPGPQLAPTPLVQKTSSTVDGEFPTTALKDSQIWEDVRAVTGGVNVGGNSSQTMVDTLVQLPSESSYDLLVDVGNVALKKSTSLAEPTSQTWGTSSISKGRRESESNTAYGANYDPQGLLPGRFSNTSYRQPLASVEPVEVRFEAANPRIHPPEVKGFNIVGDLRIPVFHGPRFCGKSYYSR